MKKLLTAAVFMSLVGTVSAAPVSVPENIAVSADAATAAGTQVFVNKSSRRLVISVGDWFPTDYSLNPGQTVYVSVSTDNQTVQIRD